MALGKEGWERARTGALDRAEAAFRAQIAIFPGNPEPYVARALLAAGRRDHRLALAQLRQAVVRGFTDFPRLDRSEQWERLRRDGTYLALLDSVPRLLEMEGAWPAWKDVRASVPPPDVATALADRAALDARIAAMAPALGPRLVRLWNRMSARATAARLQAYVARRGDAPDLQEALSRLFELYAGGAELRWEALPVDAARELAQTSTLALQHLPPGEERGRALVFSALARYAERDRKGALVASAVEPILSSLDQAVAGRLDVPYAALAAEGSVRVEFDAGRPDRAGARFRRLSDPRVLGFVRERLGTLALLAGGLPAFTSTTLEGASFGSDALRGKVAVVDFWATWCGPCLEELPTLRRIQERHGDDVLLVGISLDGADEMSSEALAAWTVRERVPGMQLRDGRGWESDLVRSFGVREIPFSVVVGADGAVLAIGERGRKLERAVEDALRDQLPASPPRNPATSSRRASPSASPISTRRAR